MSLFDIRNAVFLGNYQSAINLAESFRPDSENERLERDILLYRAMAQQGDCQIVLNEIKDGSPLPLMAIKHLAAYLARRGDKAALLDTLKNWKENGATNDPTIQIVAGLIYFKENLFEECFAVLHPPKSLEASAILVQIYLSMNRLDLANKELLKMKERQDDAVPTQIARAWVNLEGRDRVEESLFTFQELKEKYGESVLILNGIASAHMHLGEFQQAEQIFLNILILDKNSVATKINLYVCASHLGKSKDKLARDFSQLVALAPSHPWVLQQQAAEQLFDSSAAKFSPSK